MNKQKMILAVIGGVFGLALLVMGYFVFAAYQAKTVAIEGDADEGIDGLDAVVSNVEQLSRKPVYPCLASIKAIESNTQAVVEWKGATLKQASRGDRFFDRTSAAAFKTMVVADAKRLAALPGSVGGRIMKPDFGFGPFRDYIAGGKMPEESQLSKLQRQWDDIATMIEILSKCGIAEVTATDLQVVAPTSEAPAGKTNKKPVSKKPKAKAPTKTEEAQGPCVYSYTLAFTAKPAAFIQVINAFATSERFVVIDDFSFVRTKDAIAQSLGGEVKNAKEAPASGSRRSRRRGQAAEEQKAKESAEEPQAKNGIVTDPSLDAPLAVTLKLSVLDFRSLEESDDEKSKDESEGKSKEGKK